MPLQATSGAASYDAFGGGVPAVPNYIEDVFSTWLYTGNGSTQTITNGIDLAGKGGLVWAKIRQTGSHQLHDTARGINYSLYSDDTSAQDLRSDFSSLNANGFTLTAGANINASGSTYVSWTFREQPKFFDVVTYTGNGATNRSVAHNLQSMPGFVMIKRTDSASDWYVAARMANTDFLVSTWTTPTFFALNSTGAAPNDAPATAVATDSVFHLRMGGDAASSVNYTNINGATYVAYLFAHNAGGFGLSGTDNVISCGSYTGTGAAGNNVTLGYEPQWVLIKRTDTSGFNWNLIDNMRDFSVTNTKVLFPNLSDAEFDAGGPPAIVSPTATGFTLNTASTGYNASGGTYIYIAIRRGPMKTPTTGTSVFAPVTYTGNGTTQTVNGPGFPLDLTWIKGRSPDPENPRIYDRLRGATKAIDSTSTAAETTRTDGLTVFTQSGFTVGSFGNENGSGSNIVSWNFGRAPGFFDEVCYTGNGVDPGQILNHNLGVFPQLIICKSRSTSANWPVSYSADSSFSDACTLGLNLTSGDLPSGLGGQVFGLNSTTFYAYKLFNDMTASNAAGVNYVAYLFASCPGVSKVGRYTGTGTTQTINCGFTGGARFVMIKRFDSTGDWYVWDSARGIVAGNDPYLLLNSTAAEVTNTDFVDTAATGFEISSTAPAAINASGGTFIFLAIA